MTIASLKEEIQNQINIRYTVSEIEEAKDHTYCVEPWDEDEGTYACVVPAPMMEEFNYIFASEAEAWAWLVTAREVHPDGKHWNIKPECKQGCGKHLYALLADVIINDEDEIDENFLHFDQGTDRTEIWHWLESEFDVSVAELEGVI